jgi:ABC-type lipoprotein release transport system permease subunit
MNKGMLMGILGTAIGVTIGIVTAGYISKMLTKKSV